MKINRWCGPVLFKHPSVYLYLLVCFMIGQSDIYHGLTSFLILYGMYIVGRTEEVQYQIDRWNDE